MELIIISESKIKLMLSSADMAHYSGGTKEILRGIVADACEKCGISSLGSRLFVQMYPSREGGCELFVTRLGDREIHMQAGEERTLTEYRRYIYRERGNHIIYAFDEMNHLLACCYGLFRAGYSGSSRAYHDPDHRKYYLKLDCETPVPGENFGTLCPGQLYYYINEHCDIICMESAVEKLGKLA